MNREIIISRQPLLEIIKNQNEHNFHGAALSYIPDYIPRLTGLKKKDIIERFFEKEPILLAILKTYLGNIANIALPIFGEDLYHDKNHTRDLIYKAINLAKSLKISEIALTGLLPSATNYAVELINELRSQEINISIGHSTTIASIILNSKNILDENNRDLSNEKVGVLGLGSIGYGVLQLMLQTMPAPKEIYLSDLYINEIRLNSIKDQLVTELNYKNKIHIIPSIGSVPTNFYDATLIIGATNVPDILEINKLQKNTIIIDDSAPLCFNLDKMISRYENQKDIIFLEGGLLKLSKPIKEIVYLPENLNLPMLRTDLDSAYEIGGCVFSPLINFHYNLPNIGGIKTEITSIYKKHFNLLLKENISAVRPQCKGYLLKKQIYSMCN